MRQTLHLTAKETKTFTNSNNVKAPVWESVLWNFAQSFFSKSLIAFKRGEDASRRYQNFLGQSNFVSAT